jgi:multidrug efflux pump subunit AcrB
MRQEGLSAYEATKKAMRDIGGALIATSLVLCAVFVPVSFLPGISGMLYRQFTITIAVSVIISTIVALTLSPVMCSKYLRPDTQEEESKNRLFRFINRILDKGNMLYEKIILGALNNSKQVFILFIISIIAVMVMMKWVPQSFIPQEDQGYFMVELELPQGASLERTREVTDRAMEYLMAQNDVEHVLNVTGSSPRAGVNQSRSQMTVIMKPWEEREEKDISTFMNNVRRNLSRYPESIVHLSSPPVIPGLGSSGGFEMALEARGNTTYPELQMAVDTLLHYASQSPELARVSSSMQDEMSVSAVSALETIAPETYTAETSALEKTSSASTAPRNILAKTVRNASSVTWLCGLYRIENNVPVFVVLTREPGRELSRIHDRMPLILPPDAALEWVRPQAKPEDLLKYSLTEMEIREAH